MTSTPKIHQMVRDGRVSPYDGALLIELRARVQARRERVSLRQRPLLGIAVMLVFFFLGLVGVRREA